MRDGAEARQARSRGHRLHQRPRHLDAAGRRDRAGRGQAAVRRRTPTSSRCRRPNRRSATCWAPPARRGDLLDPGDPRQVVPPTLNLDNPSRRLRHRPGAEAGARSARSKHALSNSFGFGGTNASLIFTPVAVNRQREPDAFDRQLRDGGAPLAFGLRCTLGGAVLLAGGWRSISRLRPRRPARLRPSDRRTVVRRRAAAGARGDRRQPGRRRRDPPPALFGLGARLSGAARR